MSRSIDDAPWQPATNYVDSYNTRHGALPKSLCTCGTCSKSHHSRHMVVKVYYDFIIFRCADGYGCKAKGWRAK